PPRDLPAWIAADRADRAARRLLREPLAVERRPGARIVVDGRNYLDVSSNDYLGLALDPVVARAVADFVLANGWGSAASPLVVGRHPAHDRLERDLAAFEEAEDALLFGSGYAANVGVLTAVAGPGDLIFCEKRNHASLVDGCRLSGAKLRVFRVDRLEDLERRLAAAVGFGRRYVVVDTVFSMDGDVAPLAELREIADRRDAVLMVDEAHATGVLGPGGRGAAHAAGVAHRTPLRVGTLSKGLGGVGGFVVGPAGWIDAVRQAARSYIYSTAPPAAAAVAGSAALARLAANPDLPRRAQARGDELRTALAADGWNIGRSTTPIVPVIVGDADEALRLAAGLRDAGVWATAIRPPTVPNGTARLRLSVGAAHASTDAAVVAAALRRLR
ncbi:MAG: aminotransferase class I/II-fold pyridoxal phosphate-dependent enzyme, partial [Planctomycetia bacterium]